MKIGIIGKGFVGNAVGNGFKQKGCSIRAYDKYKSGDSFESVAECNHIFICVPTPPQKNGAVDLSNVEETIEKLAKSHSKGIIAIKSTVIPGTAQAQQNRYPDLTIISNPEFLTASTAEFDFLNPDKIIIGYTDSNQAAAESLAELYHDFEAPIRIITSEEAEMTKYMINTYYATRVLFANEIYDICQALSIDYSKVRECFELDKRVAPGHFDVLYGGYRGIGGECLPKDLNALISKAEESSVNLELLKTVREKNQKLRGK